MSFSYPTISKFQLATSTGKYLQLVASGKAFAIRDTYDDDGVIMGVLCPASVFEGKLPTNVEAKKKRATKKTKRKRKEQ